jgi:hypothetical protein
MWQYLMLMLEQRDYHGARDAIADIEIMLAKHPVINDRDTG